MAALLLQKVVLNTRKYKALGENLIDLLKLIEDTYLKNFLEKCPFLSSSLAF